MRRRMAALRDQASGVVVRVAGMQAKLHRWAVADPGRRFDDLYNFVYDPATLIVAYARVAGNRGANTPGVNGKTVAYVEERVGCREFLADLRAQLKEGAFVPLPVRERKIPKPGGSGKVRQARYPRPGHQFRRVNGHLHLPRLRAALDAHFTENVTAASQNEDQKAA